MASQSDHNSPYLVRSVVGRDLSRIPTGSLLTDILSSEKDSSPEKKSPAKSSPASNKRGGGNNNNIRNELLEKGVILIEDVDEDFLADVIWPFVKLSGDANCGRIRLLINSPGGYVTEMSQLISMIRNSQKPVIAEIVRAYSAGFIIASQCHERVAYRGSNFMYHLPWGGAHGNIEEIDQQTKYLKDMTTYMENLVAERTKIGIDKLQEYRHQDWWMGSKEALRLGVIDRIHEEETYALNPEYIQDRIKKEQKLMDKLEQI